MFLVCEKKQKNILNYSIYSLFQNNIIMKHQNILNLLNEPSYSKLVTRKWNIANNQSNANYDVEMKLSKIQEF